MDTISKIILALLLRVCLPILQLSTSVRGTKFGTRHLPFTAVGTDPPLPTLLPMCWQGFSRTLASWRLCLYTAYPTPLNLGSLAEVSMRY